MSDTNDRPERPERASGLGRGLGALIPQRGNVAASAVEILISRISPNPYQPRKHFSEEDLASLRASIAAHGVLQPILVSETSVGYQLVAGERRLRAAQAAGLDRIPAVIRQLVDRDQLELALVENLQRADLNPIEEAEGYSRLVAEFDLTQQEVAAIVGKDRSTVANSLRLLNLPVPIREMVQASRLSVGHARALLAIPSERVMIDLAREAVAKNLSVRDIERRVKQATTSARPPSTTSAKTDTARLAEIRRVTDRLRRRLQTDVTVDIDDKDRGQLRITFYSADDLNRLIELITGHTTEDL